VARTIGRAAGPDRWSRKGYIHIGAASSGVAERGIVLFVHQVHQVVGTEAERFEDAFRQGWMGSLAEGSDARLLWYFDLAHGSGLAYRVVTVTGVEDGAAWERVAERIAGGDLRSWARHLDGLQHRSTGRILTTLPWSPPPMALADVPTEATEREPVLYMEDTMWPFPGRLREYIAAAGAVYRPALGAEDAKMQMHIELALQTLPGAGRSPEVTLLQRLTSLPRLLHLLTNDLSEAVAGPGSWMHEALALRDQWRSKLLRTAPWSPLP
jgi:hypothetical protein